MKSVLLIEPAKVYYEDWPAPLGLTVIRDFLKSKKFIAEYIDLSSRIEHKQKKKDLVKYLFRKIREDVEKHDLIGISITYRELFSLVLELCEYIKNEFPNKKILLGGRHIATLFMNDSLKKEYFENIDYMNIFDGENTILELAKQTKIVNIPNLIYLNKNKIKVNKIRNDLPLSEIPVLNQQNSNYIEYEIGRGCYYKNCNHCSFIYDKKIFGYREKPVEKVVKDLKLFQQNFPNKRVIFMTDSMSIKQAKEISKEIIKNKIKVKWVVMMRFEKRLDFSLLSLMKKAGCQELWFGLESGDEYINKNIVNKGIELDDAKRILRDTYKVKIKVSVFSITGLPSETFFNAIKTFAFYYKNKKFIYQGEMLYFGLNRYSSFFKNPKKFGITKLIKKNDWYIFKTSKGYLYRKLFAKIFIYFCYIYFNLFSNITFFLNPLLNTFSRFIKVNIVDNFLNLFKTYRNKKNKLNQPF